MKKQLYKCSLVIWVLLTGSGVFAQRIENNSTHTNTHKSVKKISRSLSKGIDKSLDGLTKAFDIAFQDFDGKFEKLGQNFEKGFENFGKEVEENFRDVGRECKKDSIVINDEDDSEDYNFDVEKSKKISKTFKVSSSDKLDIENKFGKVHVNTWDKNEISVDVVVIARANSESKAQEILEKIRIDVVEGNVITFRTQILNQIKSHSSGGKKGFEVNYTVNMPKNNPLRLKNSFGDAYIGPFSGKSEIDVSYGSLKTERLNHTDNSIKVAFGNGNILYAKNCKLDISYSDFTLGSSENINLNSSFSDIKIESAGEMVVKNKYGDVKIGNVGSIQGNTGFADFTIKNLTSSLDMKVQYSGGFEVKNIAKNFKLINLDSGFSSVELSFSPDCSFNFDISTSFGDIDMNESFAQFNKIEKKDNSNYYKGKFGKSSSSSNVIIKGSYGEVQIEYAD